jgi:hypothetical protein
LSISFLPLAEPGNLASIRQHGLLSTDRLLDLAKVPESERVERHLRAFGGRPQILLTFDASQLLDHLGDRIYLSPINSGNARRPPVPRSTLTFVPYPEWVETGWRTLGDESRAPSCPPAEILLEGNLTLEPFLVSACMARRLSKLERVIMSFRSDGPS